MKRTDIFLRSGAALLIVFTLIFHSVTAAAQSCTAPDVQAPTAPKGLTVSGKTHTSVSLMWTSSNDNIAVKGYQVYRDGKKISTTSKATYTNSNLVPGKQYAYAVRAYDAAGNVSESSTVLNVTTVSDTQSPSTPANLTASPATHTSVSLTWKPATDNVGIKGYELYCDDKKIASTSDTYYEYKKLTPGMTYTFYIKAYDKVGNYSSQSNNVSVTTVSDKKAPAPPTGLKAASVSVTEVNLTWIPASDNVKVSGYDIICDGIKIGTTTKTSYTSKSLFPEKNYTYTVRAFDISGNLSDSSSPLNVTTLKDLQSPAAPSDLKIIAVNGPSVTLSWEAPTDNGKVAGYQIYCGGIVISTSTAASRIVKNPFAPGRYEFWVKAYDQSGNLSGSSNTVTAVTTSK